MATAPELQISDWFNTETKPSLAALRGKVVVLHAFQMLCPGCVVHALPQMSRLYRLVDPAQVAVVGLHAVFEHHEVMTPQALAAFIHEYRLGFPIAVDAPSPDGDIPLTMRAYGFEGTPSLVLIDREGRIRLQEFGQVDELALGLAIGQLVARPFGANSANGAGPVPSSSRDCSEGACGAGSSAR